MKVYTVHDRKVGDELHQERQLKLIELWAESWRKRGWEPEVLSADLAAKHRFWDVIKESQWLRHTVNDWPYMLACYAKWAVMAQVGGMYSDPDVMNYGFTPEVAMGIVDAPAENLSPITKLPVVFCPDAVPSCLWGEAAFYDCVMLTFRNVAVLNACGERCVFNDLSDMNIFRDYWRERVSEWEDCANYKEGDWKIAMLVHYHQGACGPDRVEEIMRVRPI